MDGAEDRSEGVDALVCGPVVGLGAHQTELRRVRLLVERTTTWLV